MNAVFKNEIEKIQNEEYRDFIKYYLDECTPKYFYSIGASSSGKFHPKFSQGEGGLVRHTQAVVMFAETLLELSSYRYLNDEYKDYVYMACILHDTVKYGFNNEITTEDYAEHAENAAFNVNKAWVQFFNNSAPELLLMAIKSHMGQWSTCKDDRPFTTLDRVVHLADYMASRKFIDIPTLSAEGGEKEEENA